MLLAIIMGFCYKKSTEFNDITGTIGINDSTNTNRMALPGIIIDLYQVYNIFLKVKPDKLLVVTDIEDDVDIDIVLEAIRDSKINAHILSFIKKLKNQNNYFQFTSKDKLISLFKETLPHYDKIFIYYTGHVENGSILLPIYSEISPEHKVIMDSITDISLMNINKSENEFHNSQHVISFPDPIDRNSTASYIPSIPSINDLFSIDKITSSTPSINLRENKVEKELSSISKEFQHSHVPKFEEHSPISKEFQHSPVSKLEEHSPIFKEFQHSPVSKLEDHSFSYDKILFTSDTNKLDTIIKDDTTKFDSQSVKKIPEINIDDIYLSLKSSTDEIPLLSSSPSSSSKILTENLDINKNSQSLSSLELMSFHYKGVDDVEDLSSVSLLISDDFLQLIIENTDEKSEIMIIMDCCMSDGLKLPYILKNNVYRRSINGNIEYAYHSHKRILLITSTLPNENSIATKKGSVFTGILCRNILQGKKSLIKLINTVQSETKKTYKQTPTIYVNNPEIKSLFNFLFPGENFKAEWNPSINAIELRYIL